METKDNGIHLGFSRDGFHVVRPPPPCAAATTAATATTATATATTATAATAATPLNADADANADADTGVGHCRRSEPGALRSRLGRTARRHRRPVGGGGGSGGGGGDASSASGGSRRRVPFIEVSCAHWFPQLPQLRVLCANLQLAQGSPLVAGERLRVRARVRVS